MNIKDEALRKVIGVATEKVPHMYAGHCPDSTQPDMRDHACLACQVLLEAERATGSTEGMEDTLDYAVAKKGGAV